MSKDLSINRRQAITGIAIGASATCVLGSASIIASKDNNGTGAQRQPPKIPVSFQHSKASGTVGMNLSPPTYYSNTHPFINRIKTAADFANAGPVNKSGYPIGPSAGDTHGRANTIFSIEPMRVGITNQWIIIHNGKGAITFENGNAPIGPLPVLVSGAGTQRVVYNWNDTSYSQCILHMVMTTWPTHIAVIRADQEALYNAGEIFNPAYVASCAQWSVLRFMDWLSTNYFNPGTPQTGNTSWRKRSSQSYLTWCTSNADGSGGVPVEVCAALCAKAQCDMWYNVPFKYSRPDWQDAFVYLKSALGSQKLHVEYANEVWNYGFQQTADADTAGAAANPPVGGRIYYGQQVCQIAQDAVATYAGSRDQLVTHLSVQEVNQQTYLDAEAGFRGLGFEVSDLIDEVSGTFYIDAGLVTSDAAAGTVTAQKSTILNLAKAVIDGGSGATAALNTVFAQIHNGRQIGFTAGLIPTVTSHKADTDSWASLAANRGWDFGTYEGQLYHWPISNSGWTPAEVKTLISFVQRVEADPRTASFINEVLSYDRAKLRGTFMVYYDLGAVSQYGPWGTKAQLYDPDTTRQTAYKAFRVSQPRSRSGS